MDYLDSLRAAVGEMKQYDAMMSKDIENAVNAMDQMKYEDALSNMMSAHCGLSFLSKRISTAEKELDHIEALDAEEAKDKAAKPSNWIW